MGLGFYFIMTSLDANANSLRKTFWFFSKKLCLFFKRDFNGKTVSSFLCLLNPLISSQFTPQFASWKKSRERLFDPYFWIFCFLKNYQSKFQILAHWIEIAWKFFLASAAKPIFFWVKKLKIALGKIQFFQFFNVFWISLTSRQITSQFWDFMFN